MRLPEKISPSSHRSDNPLPAVLTLQEAALRSGMSTEILWEEVRAGRLPFTLVSGRRDDATSVLLHTEDLARAGILPTPLGGREEQPAGRPPVTSPWLGPELAKRPAKTPKRSARLGWYAAAAVAAVVSAMALVGVVPPITPTSSSNPDTLAISQSANRACQGRSKQSGCRTAAQSSGSRRPKGSTVGPRAQPRTAPISPGRSTTAGWTAPKSGLSQLPVSVRSPLPRQAPPSPEGPGFSVPPNIPSNCSRDVTSDLLAWIRTVPDNSTLDFPSGSCYRIDGRLLIANRTGLTFEGNGTTFRGKFHTQGNAPHVDVAESKNITFRHMTVTGANPHGGIHTDAFDSKRQWEAAWQIKGSEGIVLDSVQAYDVFGDFVTIEPLWVRRTAVTSRNVTVQGSRFERNGRQGISITGADGVTIRNNYIGQVRHSLLDLEPHWPTLPINNVRFIGNRTGPVRLLWMPNGGKCNAGVSNIYIVSNVMEGDASGPIKSNTPSGCAPRGPFTIEGNTLIKRQGPGSVFWFNKAHDVMIRNNKVRIKHDYRTRVLVNLLESTRVSVLNNVVTVDPRDTFVWVTADRDSNYIQSGNRRL